MGLFERAKDELRRVRVWQGICVLMGLFWIVDHWLTLDTYSRDQRVVLLDGEGTYYVGSLRVANRQTEALADLARLTAQTIFNRGPKGYLAPERLHLLFGRDARKELSDTADSDTPEYRANNIYQMVDVGKITKLDDQKDEVVMSAQCLRVRTRNFEGSLQEEKTPLTLLLRYRINRDITSNGMYPYVCVKYKITNPRNE